jgi:apolipoprotein N-acyltransferase
MTTKDRELLRPEDATSLEEFQARRIVEQAQIRAMHSSWKDIGRIFLSSLIVFIDIFFWYAMAKQAGPGRWAWLVLALVFAGLFLRIFGRIELRGVRGSKRYMQLDRLSKEWQARAARGEIPQTTPGGPKVWRDELDEAETR